MTPCLDRASLTADDMALLAELVESRPAVRWARRWLDRAIERYRQAPTAARLAAVERNRAEWRWAIREEAGRLYDRLWPDSA